MISLAVRTTAWFTDVAADAQHAVRQWRRRPTFTALLVLALGLGIGASVTLVTVVNSFVLRPLPFMDESRARVFWQDYSWTDEEYDFLRPRVRVFDELAVFSTDGAAYSVSAAQPASVLQVVVSSPTLFAALGAHPLLGRLYDADDDRPNAAPVVVISYGLWQQDFAGNPNVIGRSILLDNKPATIIGVMPRGFFFPTPDLRAWRPLQLDATQEQYKSGYLTVVARTRAGATDAQVNGEMQRLAAALGARFTYPAAWNHGRDASAIPVHTYVLGNVREPLILLLAAVALLFLIACANAAALMLARSTDRSTEMAIRAALGAGAGRLARQVIVESLMLAMCAAAAGSFAAVAGFRIFVTRLPLPNGLDQTATVGGLTFAAAFVLAVVVTLAISVVPVRRLLRGAPGGAFTRERGDAALRHGTRRMHGAIIAMQAAFAVLLIVGATLLVRSVDRIRSLDPGFDSRGVTTYSIFAGSGLTPEVRGQLFQQLLNRVTALPGVAAAGFTNRLPVRDLGYQTTMSIEGRPELEGARKPTSLYRTATPEFFRAMSMHIAAGRAIDSTDVAGSQPVAVVSESFAKTMWPGQSALGKHVVEGWSGTKISRTVVGVAREVRLNGLTKPSAVALWVPLAQTRGPVAVVLVVKSDQPNAAMMSAVRRLLADAGAHQFALARAQTMDDAVNATLAAQLRLRFFFSVFAALALTLGGIGVFGVVSYVVARRQPEFAVRMALGASPRRIERDVMRFGLAPLTVGIIAGSFAAALGMRSLAGFLYGVVPMDAPSFGTAAATLLFAGIVATLWPALRAGHISPADALRADSP